MFQLFVGNLETTAILVSVARPYITERGSCLHLQDAVLFNQAVSYAFAKVGKPGMALKDKQLTAIQHVHNGKNVFLCLYMARLNFLWGLTVCIVLCVHFGQAEMVYRHPQTSKPMALHVAGVLRIFCPCYFSLRILMNCTENAMELLAHAQTVDMDTRCCSPLLLSGWERGYLPDPPSPMSMILTRDSSWLAYFTAFRYALIISFSLRFISRIARSAVKCEK